MMKLRCFCGGRLRIVWIMAGDGLARHAARLRLEGNIVIGWEGVQALAMIHEHFPEATVEDIYGKRRQAETSSDIPKGMGETLRFD